MSCSADPILPASTPLPCPHQSNHMLFCFSVFFAISSVHLPPLHTRTSPFICTSP